VTEIVTESMIEFVTESITKSVTESAKHRYSICKSCINRIVQ